MGVLKYTSRVKSSELVVGLHLHCTAVNEETVKIRHSRYVYIASGSESQSLGRQRRAHTMALSTTMYTWQPRL